ncbi:MAG: type II secretion system protein [Erysipelotrichales bacterium]|nr:type II secretion system protein [Erysipelotrichales bacterium]
MKKKNGFTLVELLAVIVVLAIIMIIAIPNVLETMNTARKRSFALYIDKIVTNTQTQYVYDANGGAIQGAGWYVYDIKTDLGLTGTGSYQGYVTVNAEDVDNPHYIVDLFDNNYMIVSHDVSALGMPDANDRVIESLDKSQINNSNLKACESAQSRFGATGASCYTRQGYKITN